MRTKQGEIYEVNFGNHGKRRRICEYLSLLECFDITELSGIIDEIYKRALGNSTENEEFDFKE